MVRILAREKNTYIITNILTFAIKKKKGFKWILSHFFCDPTPLESRVLWSTH